MVCVLGSKSPAHGLEEGADLVDEDFGLLPGGEMPTAV